MRIPLSWLREYVDVALPPRDLAHRLTMAGLEVESLAETGGDWGDLIVVGHVLSVRPHPNADRLRLCTVDNGREQVEVVCGAPNVAEGQNICYAGVGARLFDTHSGKVERLKPAKIRGVVSNGMVCSERELGLNDEHTGIKVLPEGLKPGTPLKDVLGDVAFDLAAPAHRPDALSLLGIAHEVGAITGNQVRLPDLSYPEAGDPIEGLVTIRVEDTDLCPRYTASLVRGVRIGPSPAWLQDRLRAAGQRPINNVVDITNYVMLEYGQPLHAFDYGKIADRTVLVRQARPGERLETLDGQVRELRPQVLLIADPRGGIGLAGVMGGANSEVSDATTDILLESASFHPFNTRRTTTFLKLRSEASARFEKGLRPELPPVALRRATQLILQVAGGQAARGIWDVYPGRRPPPTVVLTVSRLRQVLGIAMPVEEMAQVLARLGFASQVGEAGDRLQVRVPYWRADIAIEDDLVEEVARSVGYDRVPTTPLDTAIPAWTPNPLRETKERLRDLLVAAGMQEVISYSLVSRRSLEDVSVFDPAAPPVKVANPMSPSEEYLRTSLRGNILRALASNSRGLGEGLALFEVGRVYLPRNGDLPEEREQAVGAFWGPRSLTSWKQDAGNFDFFDAKGILDAVLDRLGIAPAYQDAADDPALAPGRAAKVLGRDGAALGVIGEVRADVAERSDVPAPVAVLFELDLPALLEAAGGAGRRYEAPPRFPAALRDLALLIDASVPAARIQEMIGRHRLVASAILFDVYQGDKLPPGKRSLGYRLRLQAPDRTLTGDEADKAVRDIAATLEREVGAQLRG